MSCSFFKDIPVHILQSDLGGGGLLLKRTSEEIVKERISKAKTRLAKLTKKKEKTLLEVTAIEEQMKKQEVKITKMSSLI